MKSALPVAVEDGEKQRQTTAVLFSGRLGGNQQFVVGQDTDDARSLLKSEPDASSNMTFKEQMSLKSFKSADLWKCAVIEGIGTLMLVFITIWINMSPNVLPQPPDPQSGNFDNAAFFGPLIGGITNFILLTLFTFAFGPVSGAHLNPTITFATFCARLCSLPRMLLYIAFQTGGAALAGLLARVAYGSRDWKVGGCWLFPDQVPASSAFVVELVFCFILIFLAFGVGLDPRQKQVVGASLAPFLVGIILGVLSFGSGFTRYGHGGASLNPARCFGTFVGSQFPSYHWVHWVADFVACIVHAVVYFLVPPWIHE